jgi:membrane-bound serine protease (ClpP class)
MFSTRFKKILSSVCMLAVLWTALPVWSELIYVIKVHDMVERILRIHMKRGIEEAEENGADLIIFEIETPGGFVHETYKIIDPILQSTVPTLAWIHNDAISAGSLIALACDDIVMSDGGTFGAAVPYGVNVDEKMKVTLEVDKKFQSVFLKQYLSAAEANDHDKKLAKAMVISDHDDITYEDYGVEPPEDLKPGRREVAMEDEEKRPWILKLGDAKLLEKDKDKHFLCQRGEILTLSTKEALAFGISTATCNSIPEILKLDKFKHLERARVERIERSWSETVTRFLSSPALTVLLIIGTIMGISTELKMPGFGFPGIIGLTCLALLFFSRVGVGAAEWIDLVILVIGILLLGIELFVIPGFGVVGFLGIVCIFTGMFMMLYDSSQGLVPMDGLYKALWQLAAGFGGAVIAMFFVYRYITPSTPLFGKLILGEAEISTEGYTADRTPAESVTEMIGKTGHAKSMLRPSGKAIFDDKLYDVVTQGDVVEAGEEIRILDVKGNRIVVEKSGDKEED